jgi:hypothetical protein
METMHLIAENLVQSWEKVKTEFEDTKTLKDKNLLITMMYQPCELCDDFITMWSEANEITLPAKGKMRTVAAKYLFSAWAYFDSSVVVDHSSTNRTLHTQHDTYTYTRIHTKGK